MSLTKSSKAKLVFCTILVLFLSACKITVHSKFNKDGSGVFNMSFIITYDDLIALMDLYESGEDMDEDEILDYILESMGIESIDELCAGMAEEMGNEYPDAYIESNETSEGFECVIIVPFDSIDEYIDMQDSENIEVSLDRDGNFTYRLAAGEVPQDLGDFEYYQEYFGMELIILWNVTVPGKIISHNGRMLIGNTVTWNLLEIAKEGEDLIMEVRSEINNYDPSPSKTPTSTPLPKATSIRSFTPTNTLNVFFTNTPLPTLTYTRFPTTTFTSIPEPTMTSTLEPAETSTPEPTVEETSGTVEGERNDEKGGGLDIRSILIVALVVIVGIILFQAIQQMKSSGEEM